jgi:DNA-binding transcriptional ArsR family regulator
MSQSQPPAAFRADRTDNEPAVLTDADAVQGVLDAVDDADCRDILEATREDARTVGEIADHCELAQSTAYRKVDILADADLLEESLRIRESGKHVSEYSCCVEDLTLSVSTDDGIELTVSHTETDSGATFDQSFDTQANVADD